VAPRLAQEQLQRVRRRLHGRCQRDDGLGVGGLFHDLDRALIELAQHRVLLELRQLVHLGDLREIRGADGPDLLGLLQQLPDLLDEEYVIDVDLGHAAGEPRAVGDNLSRSRPDV
jgi:hypothetical protein